MQARLLLGPAGSGKTFRCLAEIRKALLASAEGAPLLLIAPKQTTYQLERELLRDNSIAGYTRLRILSFERLAEFVFEQVGLPEPKLLDEEGRVMVLRSVVGRRRNDLKLFRASARLTGFAHELSRLLEELQRHQLSPERLKELSAKASRVEGLGLKLHDLAVLLEDYLGWLRAHNLKDADCLLSEAAGALGEGGKARALVEEMWVDGFAEFSPQELDLLGELMPFCGKATVTFCLEKLPGKTIGWLSNWSVAQKAFEKCKARLEAVEGVEVSTELLERKPEATRFSQSPVLRHLENCWAAPEAYEFPLEIVESVRIAKCADYESEARVAAREILRFTRQGGRYREVTVLVRNLEAYHSALERVFSRYEIPFFLDRRDLVSHHPLAELTRSALRAVLSGWRREELFAAWKTGLFPAKEEEIDWLETEALARGWSGSIWEKEIVVKTDEALTKRVEELRRKIFLPLVRLESALGIQKQAGDGKKSRAPLTGPELTKALRNFWQELGIEERLEQWAAGEGVESGTPNAVHATVWEQMNRWLENVELAFAGEGLSLREWVPILEAGLAGLTIGLIPPGLDQVLIGSIDRSRNPDVKLALVLGLNETVFPASPRGSALLTDTDRAELAEQSLLLSGNMKEQLSRERFLAYIACTRARQRLVLTFAERDSRGTTLNPSPFLEHVKKLFPELKIETASGSDNWRESEHASELIGTLLKRRREYLGSGKKASGNWKELEKLPVIARVMEGLDHFQDGESKPLLSPELAAKLYGKVLRTSVSRLEQFAACAFKFFTHSGLRAEERKKFELDYKEQGNFQHEVLARFHEELHREGKKWRDVEPAEARERVGRIASEWISEFREGLLKTSDEAEFTARILIRSLQDFVEVVVDWMREQYEFDPVQVEIPFGNDEGSPAWEMALGNGHRLAVRGRIDRVDLFREAGAKEALCVVVDYKSSQKKLEGVLIENGLQLQLLTYLAVLRNWLEPKELFKAARLIPAGVFYVNLQGNYKSAPNRRSALEDVKEARKMAYQHTGRFDASVLQKLDSRIGIEAGDMFNFRLTKNGKVNASCREPMSADDFEALLISVEANLKSMGEQIFSGQVEINPYRKGAVTACDQCEYQGICRIDAWTHPFRILKNKANGTK